MMAILTQRGVLAFSFDVSIWEKSLLHFNSIYYSNGISNGEKTKNFKLSNPKIIEISNKNKVLSDVVEILWHPLSSKDSHIVTLAKDGILSLYDVLSNTQIPEQEVHLNGINMDSAIGSRIAVSVTLGKESMDGWERVTAFVLTNDGDIYTASPFIPRECTIEKLWIENLLTSTEVEVEELKSEQYFVGKKLVCPPELQDATSSNEWVNSIFNMMSDLLQSSESDYDLVESDYLSIVIPHNLLKGVKFSGPFLQKPSPPEIYNDDDDDDSDTISNSSESIIDDAYNIILINSHPVAMLAVSYYGSKVNLFGIIEPIFPKWELKKPELSDIRSNNYPSLLTLESISFSENAKIYSGPILLTTSDVSTDTIFAQCSSGIYKLQTANWSTEFKKRMGGYLNTSSVIENQDNHNDNLEKLVTKLIKGNNSSAVDNSEISEYFSNLSINNNLINSGNHKLKVMIECLLKLDHKANICHSQPIIGFAEIIDIYLSYSAVAIICSKNKIGLRKDVAIGFSMMLMEEELNLLSIQKTTEEKAKALKAALPSKKTALTEVDRLTKNKSEFDSNLESVSLDAMLSSFNKFELSIPRFESGNGIDQVKRTDFINEDTLHVLGAFAAKVRFFIQKIVDSGDIMHQRLEMQLNEFEKQKKTVSELSDMLLVSSIDVYEKTLYRIIQLKSNQDSLLKRVELLLLNLSESQKNLTKNKELEFKNEVVSISKELNGDKDKNKISENTIVDRADIVKEIISKMRNKADNVLRSFGNGDDEKIPERKKTAGYGYGDDFDSDPESEVIIDTDFFTSINTDISELKTQINQINGQVEKVSFSK
ncbi:Nuclear pore complex protein NUP88 [Smittium culicis]|uniref:Nuclear pore complex protein NUP88 n=1 Tax=Smittium culicis TaxID=133412 RepID=A0A1R1Y4Y0_9FUNG|nr:Nuclear pore complex protein NUP88 [Smittium culicis]